MHDPGESEGQLQIACSLVVHCDAVVIGSGAGGGAAAAVLAEAGLKVVVVEKSSWQRASELSQQEAQAFETMYERSGFLSTEDGAVGILAGSTFGGGTTINWVSAGRDG